MQDTDADTVLQEYSRLIREEACASGSGWDAGSLKAGVDLGTSNIVLTVVDADDNPVTGATYPSTVVGDGVVVDYIGAVSAVRRLKAQVEERLGCELTSAGTAIPPGIHPGNVRSISNVVEAAGFEVADITEEPTAAARLLGVRDGAIVDVGGGTTGISILRDGEVVFTADEATGGTHMTLVLAGAYGVSFEEAEILKKDIARADDVFAVVRPVVEKMAEIVTRFIRGYEVETIHVVGGACSFDAFEQVFRKQTGRTVIKPAAPLLVTPLGIAMYGASGNSAGRIAA